MSPTPTIAFVTLATSRYLEFVAPLLASCRQHFLTDCAVTPIVLTDRTDAVSVESHRIEHLPWPGVTLRKFGALERIHARLSQFDYVYLCDVDMRFDAPVGREVLGDLVAVQHPGFFDRSVSEFSYERRTASRACIPQGRGRRYYCAAFLGGRSTGFLDACAEIQTGVDADSARGIVAVWHDESHWNHYLVDHPPTVDLPPSYCYPEGWTLPFPPRLVALEKDHVTMRYGWLRGLAAKAGRKLRHHVRIVLRRLAATIRRN